MLLFALIFGVSLFSSLATAGFRPTFDIPPYQPVSCKIILEEHCSTNLWNAALVLPANTSEAANPLTNELVFGNTSYLADVQQRLSQTTGQSLMLADMDANNVCLAIMSIVAPGVQGIENTTVAVNMATQLNNQLSASYGSGPNASRFRFFCNVPMQSPSAAVAEMNRCLQLPGAVGVMIHGFSNIDNDTGVLFPDQGEGIESFWAAVEASGRPLYLHTRTPSTTQLEIYQNGYGMLSGSAYGFTDWGALELIRLMLGGFFDRYPNLNIIVGHAGEAIPYILYRMDQRIRHFTRTWNATQTLQFYWENNVISTMSGVQSQSTFSDLFRVASPDRVMASCDYPFEDMSEIMGYFDTIDINFQVKQKMAFGNAQSWFSISGLVTPTASPATGASGTITETVTVTATQVVTSAASATSQTTLKTTTSAPKSSTTTTSSTKPATSSTTTTTSATPTPTTGTLFVCEGEQWVQPCNTFTWTVGQCVSLLGNMFDHNFNAAGPNEGAICQLYSDYACTPSHDLWVNLTFPGTPDFEFPGGSQDDQFGSFMCVY